MPPITLVAIGTPMTGARGVGCENAAQMRCLACRRDDDAKALRRRILRKLLCDSRGAVCRADADLNGNVEGLQAIDAFFHHLEIAVRAHDDQNLFHVIFLLKNKLGHGDIPVS